MAKKSPRPALEDIYVSLHLDKEPHVRVNVPCADVYGAQEIVWKISPRSPVKDFYFMRESVYFTKNAACFIHPETRDHERGFSVYNTYALSGDCSYILIVEHAGRYYSTVINASNDGGGAGDPMIHNR